jgi:hypothetical protein
MAKEDDESGYTSQENDLDISLSSDSEEEEGGDEEDEEEEEEESEEEEEDENGSASEEENVAIEIVEAKVEKDHGKENENRKIRLKCSICRKKMRIYPNQIIVNKNILELLDILDENLGAGSGNVVKQSSAEVKVFCRYCKIVEAEIGHLQIHEDHKKYLFYLTDNELTTLKSTAVPSNSNPEENKPLISGLENLINSIFSNVEFKSAEGYLTDYFNMYSKIRYLKNKAHSQFTKLYEKFNSLLAEKKYEQAEKYLDETKFRAKKYYHGIGKLLAMEDDIMAKLSKDKSIILDSTLIYLSHFLSTKHNKQIDYSKKFVTYASMSDQCVFIFDLRILADIYIPYEKIFETYAETKPSDYDIAKNYSEWTDIDDNGQLLFILGKNGTPSAKFRIFNLLDRKIFPKPNVPEKFDIFDRYYYNGRLFVLGGARESVAIPKCYFYDLDGDYWFDLPDLHIKRYRKSIAMFNNAFYVFSGHGADESNFKFETLNLNSFCDLEWKVFEVKGYRPSVMQPFSGFVSDKYLLTLGGQEIDSYQNMLKGFVIDISGEQVVEEFEINKTEVYESMGNFNGFLVGSATDGTFHRFEVMKNLNKLKTLI